MRTLGTIRGYANPFGVLSAPIGLGEPFRAIIRPGAFRVTGSTIPATVMHGSVRIGTAWDRSLRLWQDDHGLAIELDIPATLDGAGLLNMVAGAGGINCMSIGFTIRDSTITYDEEGLPIHDVSRAEIDHISIVDRGAFPGACCWLSDMPADRMRPEIAAASRRWHLSRIHRDQKQASNRAMLARYLAAKAAPARRRPRGKAEPILINGMQPLDFLRVSARPMNGGSRKGSGQARPLFVFSLPAAPQAGNPLARAFANVARRRGEGSLQPWAAAAQPATSVSVSTAIGELPRLRG